MSFHSEFACCHEGCMAIICLTPEQEQKLRETHESFRCPMGHAQGFYGETKQEKEIELLKRRIEIRDDQIRWQRDEIAELKRTLRSLRARLGVTNRRLRSVA